MRIISGSARGRTLKAVPGMGTRPTTDKVKEAIFSMIGPYFDGGEVLDLFAGTGGLSIEALSRGMSRAVLIDADKKALETVRHNLQAAGFAACAEVYRNDAVRALKALAKRGKTFDLVFIDPPYKMKVIPELLERLTDGGLLSGRAIVVLEHDAEDRHDTAYGDLRPTRRAEYGDTAITVYRRLEGLASEEEAEVRGVEDNGR